MNISLITPARPTARSGNRNTAVRWANFLRHMGHHVVIREMWDGQPADLMIALHARRSHASIQRFAAQYPQRPLVVMLTGTDLYRDIQHDMDAQESLRLASLLVVLQERGMDALPPALRGKTRVIYQSAPAMQAAKPCKIHFDVCVIGHLREEKDPFRAALALRHLPNASSIRVMQMGAAMDQGMAENANRMMLETARYRWLGELPRWQVRKKLARCRLLVLSSRMEGGANVICEALSAGVPVIASRIPGNIGMLGEDYAGYYPLEDDAALASLLARAESDADFYALLSRQCVVRGKRMQPEKEKTALEKLLKEAMAMSSPDAPALRPPAKTTV